VQSLAEGIASSDDRFQIHKMLKDEFSIKKLKSIAEISKIFEQFKHHGVQFKQDRKQARSLTRLDLLTSSTIEKADLT
jgi:hypothetical protein